MNIDLIINGTLALIIFNNGIEVTDKEELARIHNDLNVGNSFIGLRERNIVDGSCLKVLYTFDFEVLDTTEYNFELN